MRKMTALLAALSLLFTLSACGGGIERTDSSSSVQTALINEEINLQEVYVKMEQTGKLPVMVKATQAVLENQYGISAEDCKQIVVYVAREGGTLADEVALIEVKDEAAAKKLAQKLEQRRQNQADFAQTYSPEQYAIIQKSKVEQDGLFISLVISSERELLLQIYSNALKVQ